MPLTEDWVPGKNTAQRSFKGTHQSATSNVLSLAWVGVMTLWVFTKKSGRGNFTYT